MTTTDHPRQTLRGAIDAAALRVAQAKASTLVEALPWLEQFRDALVVVKYGGNAMIDEDLKAAFASDIVFLRYAGLRPVVVHGGGPQINDMLDKTGKKGTFIQGMRVTDDETLYVVEAVLGELNQEIVGLINQAGGKAVGLNGQDGGFIRAKKMMVESETEKGKMLDIGFVGDIYNIDPTLIHHLDAADFIPVVAPIGVGEDGQAYNINADLVASELAQTLKAEKLVLMTNTPGVLDKGGKLLTGLTYREINALFDDGTISGGMKPKIQGALDAVQHGVKTSHIIDGRVEHALLLEILTSEGVGTMIRAE